MPQAYTPRIASIHLCITKHLHGHKSTNVFVFLFSLSPSFLPRLSTILHPKNLLLHFNKFRTFRHAKHFLLSFLSQTFSTRCFSELADMRDRLLLIDHYHLSPTFSCSYEDIPLHDHEHTHFSFSIAPFHFLLSISVSVSGFSLCTFSQLTQLWSSYYPTYLIASKCQIRVLTLKCVSVPFFFFFFLFSCS